MASLTNNKIKDTYQSLVKFNDNGNITTSAKRLTDGFGNNSPFFVSTTQIGIGVTPTLGYDLHVNSNTKIGGNLEVGGNLTVSGTLTYLNVEDLATEDPLIKLARNNDANLLDIGFFGKYVESTVTKYKGLFNDADDDKWKLFIGTSDEPTTVVDTGGTGYTVGTLVANLEGGTISGTTGTFSGKITAQQGIEITGGSIAQSTAVLHTNNILYFRGGSNGLFLQNSDGSDGYYISNTDHRWDVNSSTEMRLDSTGLGLNGATPAYTIDTGETTVGTLRMVGEDDHTFIRLGAGGGGNDVTLMRIDGESSNHDGESDLGAYGFSLKYLGSLSGNENALALYADNSAAASQVESFRVKQDGTLDMGGSSIFTQFIKSNSSFRIDIDNDNNQTDRIFVVSKHNSGTELFRVQENGSVGIGTNDLDTEAKLAIAATDANEGGQIVLHKGTDGTHAAHLDAYHSTNDYLRILKGTNTATSAAPFYFDLTNDRLGIGTVPSSTLDVDGSATFTGSVTGTQAIFSSSTAPVIKSTSSSTAENILLEGTDTSAASAPDLVLYRNAGATSDNDTLGVVEFRGRNDANTGVKSYSGIYSRIIDASENEGALSFSVNSGSSYVNALAIHNTGVNQPKVIIGNTDAFAVPTHTLDVDGTLHVSSTGTFAGNITFGAINPFQQSTNVLDGTGSNGARIRSAVSSAANPTFSNSDDTNTGMYFSAADTLDFTTGGTNALSINSSQNATFAGTVNATSFVGNAAIVNQVTAATSGGDIKLKNNAGTDRVIIRDSGNVLINSGVYLSWGADGHAAIEGSTVSNRLRFYSNSTLALTLDSSQNATFAGTVYLNTTSYQGGEGDILDNSDFNTTGIGSNFRWVNSNEGTGADWKKVADVVITNAITPNGVQLEAKVYKPNTNTGQTASLHTLYYSISFRGRIDDSSTYNDAIVYGPDADMLRVYKTADYTFELQAKTNDDNRDLVVEVNITSKRGGKVTPTTTLVDGTNTGGTAYTATTNNTNKTRFAGDVSFTGATFDDATIDDLRVEGILYLGAGADATYGGYLTRKGVATEGISMKVHEDDGFDIYQVWGNGGEADLTFEAVDGGIKLYYSGDEKLATASDGVNITGNLNIGDFTALGTDNSLNLGADKDLRLGHNDTDAVIRNFKGGLYIDQEADDNDIIFRADDGSGGKTTYFYLDGSLVLNRFLTHTLYNDGIQARFGTSTDLQIYHDGTNSVINNKTGDLQIYNNADDKDIVFLSDNGSGGTETYYYLDGSEQLNRFLKNILLPDGVSLSLGDSFDLRMYHNGTNSNIENFTGTLQIIQNVDDGDIVFMSDNGSGGTIEYFRLDGSTNRIPFGRSPQIVDNVKLYFGNDTANDASIKWDSTASQLFIDGASKFLSSVTILGDSSTTSSPLIIGSSSATSYTLQQWQTSAHGTNEAYIIAYGADHGSQAGNFAMKNIEANGEIFFELASGVEPLRMTSTSSNFAGDINANSGLVHLTSDAPILRATSNNNASGFRIQVYGLDADGDDLFRVQDVGTTKFNLRRNGNLAGNWIPATDSTYDLGTTSNYWRNVYADNIYSSGAFHPLSLVSKVYNSTNTSSSISGGTSLDEEYELLEFGENASPVYLNLKSAAHSSASFVITRGYFGNNSASIQCTGSTYTANNGYPNVRGIRVIKDNNNAYKVIVRLYRSGSHNSFSLYARAWGGTDSADIVFNTTLTDTFTESTNLGGISDLSQATSLSAAYSRDTLYVDNARSRYGNSSDLQIYHDGSNSYIDDAGSGRLNIRSNDLRIEKYTGETIAKFIADGAVELNYNDYKKFETTSSGVTVTGNAIVSDNIFVGESNSTDNYVKVYHSDDHYSELHGYGIISDRGSYYIRPANDGTQTLYLGGADAGLDWSSVQVKFLTSVSFVQNGSNKLTIDSLGRVGISNTGPAYRLDVGDVGSAIRITGSGTGYTQGGVIISSGTSDTPELRGQGIFLFNEGKDVNWYMGTRYGNADEFIISRKTGTSIDTSVATTSNAIVTITNSENVGIGATNPSTKLHTYQATENWIFVDTSGTNGIAGLRTQSSNGSRQNTLYRNITSNLVTLRAGTDDGEIAFIAGGSANERMRIHESGCISVNSTTDEGRFLINQSGLGSTSGDEDTNLILMGSRHDLIFKQIRTANGSDWNNTTLRLQTRVDSTLMSSIDFVSDSSYARHIDINTASNTFNTRFTHGGSVGIATNNPSERLSVHNGNVSINNSHSFMVGGATGDTIIGRLKNTAGVLNLEADSTRQIRFGNGSQGELMRLNTYTQKVGINITNPADKLDVYNGSYSVLIGSASFSWVGSTAYPTIYGSNQDRWVMITSPHIPYLENGVSGYAGNTAGARVRFASKSGATGVVSWDAGVTNYGGTDTFTIGRDDNALVQVNSSGYMGIGGSPSHKLHIKQNTTADLVNLIEQDNASYQAYYEAKSQNSGYARFGISTDANAYAFFNTSVTSYNWYHTGGGLLMTLNSNGHLGLGITNLTFAKLAVNGAVYSSAGTFNAGTDTVTDAAFVLDEGDYIYTRDASAYARKLIGKNSTDIITIGQSGTSLIDGIDFYSGSDGANYRWFRNTSVAMQLYGSGSQPYEILDVKGRIKAETDNGSAVDVPRCKGIPYQGATGYYDFDPVAEFGHSKQGGYVLLEVNGWQTRFNAGYIHWNNNGGTGAIGTGSVTYRQIAWSGSASGAGVTVSTVSSSTNVIRISFSGWHSNSHGWKAAITNRY